MARDHHLSRANAIHAGYVVILLHYRLPILEVYFSRMSAYELCIDLGEGVLKFVALELCAALE
jgi:hypothetical protein